MEPIRPGVPDRDCRLNAHCFAGYQTKRFDSAGAQPNMSLQRSGWELTFGGNDQVTISWWLGVITGSSRPLNFFR